jgi:hypothetical protein
MAVGEWVRRYGPAELLALIGALAGWLIADLATENSLVGAYAATIGENVGYYGLLATREVRARRCDGAISPLVAGAAACGALAIEFGPAEALDSLVVRPACVGVGVTALGPVAGVLAGKLVADLAFYVPVIASYELRRAAGGGPAPAGAAGPNRAGLRRVSRGLPPHDPGAPPT